jgi:SAM-dependent methyltransferase
VLEHLPSPRAGLSQIRQWLRPGGHLFLSVPNLESWDARLFGSRWIGWDAPRHFWLFPRAVLERLFAETGFEVVGRRSILGGRGAFQLSWEFWSEEVGLPVAGRRFWAVLSYLLWPYRKLEYALNRGPILTWVVRKAEG